MREKVSETYFPTQIRADTLPIVKVLLSRVGDR